MLVLDQTVFKKAIRCAFSIELPKPGKPILIPGTYLPGLSRNNHKCSGLHMILEFFRALPFANKVEPANLPMIPPSGGAPAPFPSPYIQLQKHQFHDNRYSFRCRQTCLSSDLLRERPLWAENPSLFWEASKVFNYDQFISLGKSRC